MDTWTAAGVVRETGRGEGVYGGGLDWTLEAGAVYFSNLLAALLLGNLEKKGKKMSCHSFIVLWLCVEQSW